MDKISFITLGLGAVFTTAHFLANLTNGHIHLECLSLASLSEQRYVTIVYWAHSQDMMKMRSV